MLNIVIFSKDRALQLDSLLQSIKDHFLIPVESIVVLYLPTNAKYAAGYEMLKGKNIIDRLHWVEDIAFRNNLISICSGFAAESNIMFLVDDNIVFRQFNDLPLLGLLSKRHLFISLRADRRYVTDRVPQFVREQRFLEWKWRAFFEKHGNSTWHYPFSVDGNIFRTSDVTRLLRSISFKAPNSLEANMQRRQEALWLWPRRFALAPLHAVLFNNPLNSVQTEGRTWNAGLSIEDMNNKYLEGWRIDNSVLYAVTPESTHHYVPLVLTNEILDTTKQSLEIPGRVEARSVLD